jgi:hypothetical protein
VRGPQHELVGALVVQIDEAGVGLERLGDLAGDEVEDLLEVEGRVDGRDRLGQQPQMTGRGVHRSSVGRAVRRSLYKLLTEAAGKPS